MYATRQCSYCQHGFPFAQIRCIHCGQPALFPNVEAAEAERTALATRYDHVVAEAQARGAGAEVATLEDAVNGSHAVIARPLGELQRLAASDTEIYATYYELIVGKVRVPKGESWDVLRKGADAALFPGYEEQIRFAALSLNGGALWNYGQCSLVLKNSMIAHRASLLEENSVLWMERHNITMAGAARLPTGYRCTWEARGKLAVAKLGKDIKPCEAPEAITGRVLVQGGDSREDQFIEVHILGPLTIRSIERVCILRTGKRKLAGFRRRDLRSVLEPWGVRLEEVE